MQGVASVQVRMRAGDHGGSWWCCVRTATATRAWLSRRRQGVALVSRRCGGDAAVARLTLAISDRLTVPAAGPQLLAIKKIDMVDLSLSEQDELMDMLGNMSKLKHPNISSLGGYCVEFGRCVLLYEYAENGSLDDLLFSAATRYMHSTCSPSVAHGNIKATNILLDAQLMPYLSHCGLAKLSHFVRATRMDSEELSGAKGYVAPEPISPGTDNIKADIYSFGVILLVLLTGQKAFDSSREQNEQFLVDWASPHLHDLDSLERITDPRIRDSMPSKALSALGKIIVRCIKQSPEFRSPMTVIAYKLVQLVESTGLQKTDAAQHVEADAQDLSFITARPYFPPPSTVSQGGTESCISR